MIQFHKQLHFLFVEKHHEKERQQRSPLTTAVSGTWRKISPPKRLWWNHMANENRNIAVRLEKKGVSYLALLANLLNFWGITYLVGKISRSI